jgi:hypothetical protein
MWKDKDKYYFDYISQTDIRIPAIDYTEIVKEKCEKSKKVKSSALIYDFSGKLGTCNRMKRMVHVPFQEEKYGNYSVFPCDIDTREIVLKKTTDFATNFKITLLCDNFVIYKNKLNKFLENKCQGCNTICDICTNKRHISDVNNIYSADVKVSILEGVRPIKGVNILNPNFILPLTMFVDQVKMSFTIKIFTGFSGKIELILEYDGITCDNDFRNKLLDNYYPVCPTDSKHSEPNYIYMGKIMEKNEFRQELEKRRKE